MAKMNGLEDQAVDILEAAGLTKADINDVPSFGWLTPKPPPILTSTQNLSCKIPHVDTLGGVLSSTLDDWEKEEESHNVIDPEGGWGLDANAANTEEQEDEFRDAVGDEDSLGGGAAPGMSKTELWWVLLELYADLHTCTYLPLLPFCQYNCMQDVTLLKVPLAVYYLWWSDIATICAELTKGFHLVSGNRLQDARATFRSVLQALLLVTMSSDADAVEVGLC
ncbi:hypothetical protein F5141DRAFT_1262851 [Pisolithus sp. B1]|nr:hypothetical protein F5141DRAFT_1262851 [Pisolithus sp. B1]